MSLFSSKSPEIDITDIQLPVHIGIIMDGNGRWAKKRGLPRTAGHKVGAETFRKISRYCSDIGIKYLTVYAFSTENWRRPLEEVNTIMVHEGMVLNIAMNYGGRAELVTAMRKIAKMAANGEIKADDIDNAVTEKLISDNLYTAGQPDPDLIIRPSGEYRTSNFLLWQSAYAEYYIDDVLWPDYTKNDLNRALIEYSKRNRRFGGV